MKQGSQGEKHWQLEESVFRKQAGEVKQENLIRNSAEMFVIYKYANDPQMKVKSSVYTQDQFVPVRDLFPKQEEALFETSILQ